ncbi:LytTR family transcriptional regulator [Phenylobacterium sp. J426]|uniref:LytTR family DNA-binding domain-containing protein n=1 Tax=Phenylobacterium sp. J426 TaxID=2898439 RepID=UPI002151455F|nr:LytTR family DNA-binding domain-containing protein [Phenylobacterium sp. J426]MCR5874934.1 LytTR family transcriptional regulator [Phenylobacterium sp. J426]
MKRVDAPLLRRLATEFALLVAIGVTVAFLGPYETGERPLSQRLVYWLILMIGGGLIGIAIDEAVRRRLPGFWPRLLTVSVLMTPGIMGLVVVVSHLLAGAPLRVLDPPGLAFQVFLLSLATMALRQLMLAKLEPPAAVSPTASDPTAVFRGRLSAKRRAAALIAVEAEDHYLRVHTDAGSELVTARFADALAELAEAPGFRTHRSWWVAADAIEEVRWRRGAGEARLAGGLVVPVSRSQAPQLKAAGWF